MREEQCTTLGHGNAAYHIACQLFIQIKSIIVIVVIVRTRNYTMRRAPVCVTLVDAGENDVQFLG